MEFGVPGLEVRVQGLEFRVQGLQFRVQGLEFRVQDLKEKVYIGFLMMWDPMGGWVYDRCLITRLKK